MKEVTFAYSVVQELVKHKQELLKVETFGSHLLGVPGLSVIQQDDCSTSQAEIQSSEVASVTSTSDKRLVKATQQSSDPHPGA